MERGHLQKSRGMEASALGEARPPWGRSSAQLLWSTRLGCLGKMKKRFLNPPFHTNLFTYSSVPWDVSSPSEIYLKQTQVRVSFYKQSKTPGFYFFNNNNNKFNCLLQILWVCPSATIRLNGHTLNTFLSKRKKKRSLKEFKREKNEKERERKKISSSRKFSFCVQKYVWKRERRTRGGKFNIQIFPFPTSLFHGVSCCANSFQLLL